MEEGWIRSREMLCRTTLEAGKLRKMILGRRIVRNGA